jgi:Ca2+-binding EF-hand superfamily protein
MPIGDVDIDEYFLKSEMDEMRKIFEQFDEDKSGSVDANELRPLFATVGINMKPYQVEAIVKEYDLDGSGEVDFEEFVVMMIKLLGRRVRCDCINYYEYLTDEMIDKYEEAFRQADIGGSGSLTRDELSKMIKKMGIQLSKEQLDDIIREVDRDGSGFIEFDEYCAMLVKLTGVRKRINAREYIEKDHIDNYRAAFNGFDTSKDGTISVKELDRLLRMMNIVLRVDQIDALLTKYDADGSGEIDFTEFLSMMVDLKKLRKKHKISPNTHTVRQLMEQGFSAAEVKTSGFSPQLMRQESWPVRDMARAFKALDLRQAGYTAREMRNGGLGPAQLKRIGYSSSELRNAGFSSVALKNMGRNLSAQPNEVPHFDLRKLASCPRMTGQSTPRIRHFADDRVKVGAGNRKSLQHAGARTMSQIGVAAFMGGQRGRLSAIRDQLGLVQEVQKVSETGTHV